MFWLKPKCKGCGRRVKLPCRSLDDARLSPKDATCLETAATLAERFAIDPSGNKT